MNFPWPLTLALLLAIITGVDGCASVITPPPPQTQPTVDVYVADYGRHSSLLLPEDDGSALVEYAYGDWDWFAANHNQWQDALHALFLSETATLGRRRIDVPPQSGEFQKTTGIEHLLAIPVPRDKEQALASDLDTRFASNVSSIVYNADAQMCFVRDREHYWVFNNCNNVTATWLSALGCKVSGIPVLSNFRINPASTGPAEARHPPPIPDAERWIIPSTAPAP